MKKILSSITLIALVLCCLSSCDLFSGGEVDEKGDVLVVVENEDGSYDTFDVYLGSVENKDEGAKGIVEHLNDRENDKLYLEMSDSTYGAYVSAIGSIKESAENKMYVIVYTSVSADSYEGAPTIQYDGNTLYQSGVGLSSMKVEAGTIILFRLEKSPY